MAELLYQGHGSYRIVSNEGVVIYVDPYAGEGYDMPADIVIVTHEHSDHNQVDLVTLKDDGVILRHGDLFVDGEYPIKKIKKVMIEGTPAENERSTAEHLADLHAAQRRAARAGESTPCWCMGAYLWHVTRCA